MKLSKQLSKIALLLAGASALAGGVWAQDTQEPSDTDTTTPAKPKPAARGVPALEDPNATDSNDQATNWRPDNGPATGLQDATLGSPELGHSYWVPGFIYGSTIQSRPTGAVANSGWYADNYVGGQLSLLASGSTSQLALNYSGGGYFTTDSFQQNGWFQQLSVGQQIVRGHWQIQWFDYFSYIPESQFGYAAGTGLALPGVSGTLGPSIPGLGMSIVPNQSIYSAVGPRYSNAFAPQVTYLLSRRASLTVGGSYGLLRFTEPGNVDNEMVLGSVGFNYALNPHDTVGILYRFAGFHYDGEPQALGTQTISFVYNKKVAQKIAWSIYGGPQITSFRVPVNNQTRNIGVSAGTSLTYALQHGSLLAGYFHGVTAGSGILLGSITDQATFSVSRQFGRVWNATVNFGYSRNAALTSVPGVTSASTYNDLFGGASIGRPFGRNVQLIGSYEATHQTSDAPICSGTTCSSSYTQNVIVVTFQFQTRPFVLP